MNKMDFSNVWVKGKAINVYPEEFAIGFVFATEDWARKFYLETVLRGGRTFELRGDEVVLLPPKNDQQ